MTNQINPFINFDATKIVASFEPNKMADQLSKFVETFNHPYFGIEGMMSFQRKNIEAITAANNAAVDVMQKAAAHQAEFFQNSFETATEAFASFDLTHNSTVTAQPNELAGTGVKPGNDVITEFSETIEPILPKKIAKSTTKRRTKSASKGAKPTNAPPKKAASKTSLDAIPASNNSASVAPKESLATSTPTVVSLDTKPAATSPEKSVVKPNPLASKPVIVPQEKTIASPTSPLASKGANSVAASVEKSAITPSLFSPLQEKKPAYVSRKKTKTPSKPRSK
ncbi:MAG: phasin family protein [Sneathiella sp.]